MISKLAKRLSEMDKQNRDIYDAHGLSREQVDALKKYYKLKSDDDLTRSIVTRATTGRVLGALPGLASLGYGAYKTRTFPLIFGQILAMSGSHFGEKEALHRYTPENADKIIRSDGKDPTIDNNNAVNVQNAISGIEIPTGAALAHNALSSGQLTGRLTLYHGTGRDAAKNIRDNGLFPVTEETADVTKVLKEYKNNVYEKAMNKAFLTKNPIEAMGFAYAKRKSGHGSGMVVANIPLGKFPMGLNPKVDMPYEVWKESMSPGELFTFPSERSKRNYYDATRKEHVVVEGGVPAEYIKGSGNYQRLTLKELGEHIKVRPKTFALGVAKTLGGLGMLGHGAYQIYDRAKQG